MLLQYNFFFEIKKKEFLFDLNKELVIMSGLIFILQLTDQKMKRAIGSGVAQRFEFMTLLIVDFILDRIADQIGNIGELCQTRIKMSFQKEIVMLL